MKTVLVKCSHCQVEFTMSKKHFLDPRKQPENFCSARCKNLYRGKSFLCKCSTCGKEIKKSRRAFSSSENHFCNHSCAATFTNKDRENIWTEERKQKMSEWAKKNAYRPSLEERTLKKLKSRIVKNCPHCNLPFDLPHPKSKKMFCSKACAYKRPNQGGFRENSTRLHRCVYNGVKMDSGSEKLLAEILDKNNIKWIKNSTKFYPYQYSGKNKKYYPDFYLPDLKVWVEVKGLIYVEPWLTNKIQSVKDSGENIVMIFSKEIKEDYVLKLIGAADPTRTGR